MADQAASPDQVAASDAPQLRAIPSVRPVQAGSDANPFPYGYLPPSHRIADVEWDDCDYLEEMQPRAVELALTLIIVVVTVLLMFWVAK